MAKLLNNHYWRKVEYRRRVSLFFAALIQIDLGEGKGVPGWEPAGAHAQSPEAVVSRGSGQCWAFGLVPEVMGVTEGF